MSIVGQCPSCNRKFNAPDALLGKPARCPQCGHQFVVQAVSSGIQSAPAPAPAPNAFDGFGDQAAAPRGAAAPRRSPGMGKVGLPVVVLALGAGVLVLLVFVGGLIWLLSGSSGGQWKEYSPNGGGFSVLLPGSPDQKDSSDPKLISASRIREAAASGSKASYTVQYYDLPDKPINNYLYFSWLKNYLLSSGGKLAFEQDIAQGSYPGREVTIDLPDDQVLVRRMYVADSRVYWLTARYPKTASTAEVQKFMESFKISSADKRTQVAAAPPPPAVVATAPAPKKDPPAATMPAPPPPPPPIPKPPDVGFAVRADEQTYVDQFNRCRAQEKAAALKPAQQLFESARAEALASAEGRAAPPANYGPRNVIRMAQPLPKGLTAEQYVDLVFKNPALRMQFANNNLQEIGVGLAADKNGAIHGVFLIASPLK